MTKSDLTAARVRELLDYDPETGVFRWRVKLGSRAIAGAVAGARRPDAYWYIGIDGRRYYAHRLAWLVVHGTWPLCHIDHRDGDPSNNRVCNLRDVTYSVNQQNQRGPQKGNTSGYLGVAWATKERKWVAMIKIDGTVRRIGSFATPELAHAAYLAVKREHHQGCTI